MRLGRRSEGARVRQGRWYMRGLRGLWPGRNPLRRGSDRVETCLLAGLFVVAAAGAPFAAQAASQAAHDTALRAEQAQLASRHQVRAVLTQPTGTTVNAYSLTGEVPALATWTSAGVRHTGQIFALPGSPKGTAVTVWIDAAGNLTSPPLLPSQVTGQSEMAAIGAVTGVAVLYLCAAAVIRRVLNRRRMAAWAADWEVTARAWNRQRW